jgi:uncharacterized phiE125 gp8 family phage protein
MARLEPKTATEIRNYTFDWSTFLGTDTIATSDVTVSGVTLDSDTNDTTSVTVTLSGGTNGTTARVTNTITTAAGLTETEIFTLRIVNTAEPITFAEAAAHLRLAGDTSEQVLIEGYMTAAREWVENYTGKALVQREFVEYHKPETTGITLYRAPVVSAVVTDFADTRMLNGRLYPTSGSSWPSLIYPDLLEVTYTAGYAAGEEPQALLQAMLLLIGHWYGTRETVNIGNIVTEVPFAVTALCDQYRSPVV